MIQYFVSKQDAKATQYFLAKLLPASYEQRGVIDHGPDGGPGKCYSLPGGICGVGANQEWQEHPQVPGLWCGVGKGAKVKPEFLARSLLIDGYEVQLGDGQKWLVPCARVFPTGTRLPQNIILGKNGQVMLEIQPQFIELSKKAESVWTEMAFQYKIPGYEEPQERLSIQDAFQIAVEALTINYWLDAAVVNVLKLFNTAIFRNILEALVDIPGIVDFAKKNESAQPKSDDGPKVEPSISRPTLSIG